MAEKEKCGHQEGADLTKSATPQKPDREIEDLHLKTRRRLIQVGLMSLPVLMTVRSRPAFAQSLGSVGIPYGGYLREKVGDDFIEDDDLVPVKVNEYGEPVDADGYAIVFHDESDVHEQLILVDPTRRDSSTTMTYKEWRNN